MCSASNEVHMFSCTYQEQNGESNTCQRLCLGVSSLLCFHSRTLFIKCLLCSLVNGVCDVHCLYWSGHTFVSSLSPLPDWFWKLVHCGCWGSGGVGVGERKTVVCITVLLLVLQGACKVEQVKVNLSGMVMSWWQAGEQATVHGVPLHSVSQIQAQWTP